jgi:PAS domain S-box-containing protein
MHESYPGASSWLIRGAGMGAISSQLEQQHLRVIETSLQAAVNLLELGLYTWNPQTNELQTDETIKAIWGVQGDAPIDYEAWHAGIHPDDLELVDDALRRCTDPQGDGIYDVEHRVIGKRDGIERWVATRGVTRFDNAKAASLYGVAVDVTDRKRADRALACRVDEQTCELEELNRQLRSQVEQRRVAEATLRQSQRLQAIGQITAGVVHDFNNLLGIVITNTHTLSHKLSDPDAQKGLNLIRRAAKRGARLIAQLLDFSRSQEFEPKLLDLNAKIREMNDILSAALGGPTLVRTELTADLWPTIADPIGIELAILNLAINGRDAMHARGPLTIKTYNAVIGSEPSRPEEPSPGDYAAVAVNDTGAGISAEVLPRVFEPFFTTKEPGKGTGLGLSQVLGFVKKSNGGMHICSEPGKGTSVTILLPRAA